MQVWIATRAAREVAVEKVGLLSSLLLEEAHLRFRGGHSTLAVAVEPAQDDVKTPQFVLIGQVDRWAYDRNQKREDAKGRCEVVPKVAVAVDDVLFVLWKTILILILIETNSFLADLLHCLDP